jgi:hypothetical protein
MKLTNRLAILILLLPLCSAHAQIKWGVRTGVQYSTLYSAYRGDEFERYAKLDPWKPSIVMPGFYLELPIGKRAALSAALQYSSKGFTWPGDDYSNSYSYRLPYITAPILFHYKVQQFSFFVGPEVAYKFISSHTFGTMRQTDETILVAPFDLGASGGVAFHITPEHSLMLRYTFGFFNVIGKDTDMTGSLGNYGNARELGFVFNNHTVGLALTSEFRYAEATEKKRSFSFAVRQGVSSSTLFGEGVDHANTGNAPIRRRTGYEAGVEIRVGIRKYFFAATGLNYLQKGGQISGEEPVKVNYMSVPLIIGVSPVVSKRVTLSFYGGVGLHKVVKLVNPYRKFFQSHLDREYNLNGSLFYGIEGGLRTSEKISFFFNYRNFWDNSSVFDLNNLSFSTRGYSISSGVRLHR